MKKTLRIVGFLMLFVLILSTNVFAEKPSNKKEKVEFFISLSGQQLDWEGNVDGRDTQWFTSCLAQSTLKYKLSSDKVIFENFENYISYIPTDEQIFRKLDKKYNTKQHIIKWYVLKHENESWHCDGVILNKATCLEYNVKENIYTAGTMDTYFLTPHSIYSGKILSEFENVQY